MKRLTYIFSFILSTTLFGYGQSKTTENNGGVSPVNEVQPKVDTVQETKDVFCDTTKIKDFKTNLTIISTELTHNERIYQLKKAKDFIKRSCKRDTLFCGEINFKKSTTYSFSHEWKLLLTGYILDQETGMEDKSASFFVLTILRNNEFWFTEILEDLMGEIQVDLYGFEGNERQVTIWGQSYPYFQPDYGKFRLIIKDGVSDYEFQCHSHH